MLFGRTLLRSEPGKCTQSHDPDRAGGSDPSAAIEPHRELAKNGWVGARSLMATHGFLLLQMRPRLRGIAAVGARPECAPASAIPWHPNGLCRFFCRRPAAASDLVKRRCRRNTVSHRLCRLRTIVPPLDGVSASDISAWRRGRLSAYRGVRTAPPIKHIMEQSQPAPGFSHVACFSHARRDDAAPAIQRCAIVGFCVRVQSLRFRQDHYRDYTPLGGGPPARPPLVLSRPLTLGVAPNAGVRHSDVSVLPLSLAMDLAKGRGRIASECGNLTSANAHALRLSFRRARPGANKSPGLGVVPGPRHGRSRVVHRVLSNLRKWKRVHMLHTRCTSPRYSRYRDAHTSLLGPSVHCHQATYNCYLISVNPLLDRRASRPPTPSRCCTA